MNRDILPTILTVDDVLDLSDEMLNLFTKISTGVIVENINEFVEKYKNSEDVECRDAALKLERIYKPMNDVNAYLESDEAKSLSDTLSALQYSDVSATEDLDKLKMYRSLIIELLSEDEDFVKSYLNDEVNKDGLSKKTAYTTKFDKENLQNVLEEMDKAAGMNVTARMLISSIENNASLFKNGNYNINKPTVLRKAFYKKDKLKNILRGLDFLIPKLEAGVSPATWRRI
jgi:hypothetical protein